MARAGFVGLQGLCAISVVLALCVLTGCSGGGGSTGTSSAGAANIGATSGSGTTNTSGGAALTSITINPATVTLPLGKGQLFSATGRFSDGSSRDVTTTITWTSSNISVANISSGGSLSSLATGSSTVTATSGSISASASVTVNPPQLLSFKVTPSTAFIAINGNQQLTASATYTNGTQDVTSSAAWTSSNTFVLSVDSGGKAGALTVGFSAIQATFSGMAALSNIAVTSVPRFAYVAAGGDSSISMYTVDSATGLLKENGYTYTGESPSLPALSPSFTTCATVDPSQHYAFATNDEFFSFSGTPPNITGYQIDKSTGQLFQALRAILPAPPNDCLLFEPGGKFAYVSNGNAVSAYSLNLSSGVFTEIVGSPFPAGDTTEQAAMDPLGRFLYVSNAGLHGGASSIIPYQIDRATGQLTALPPLLTTPNSNFIAIHPSGKFAYVSYADGTTITAYSINQNTGALTPIAGTSTLTVGVNPGRAVFSPMGDKAYVLTGDPGLVTFNVDTTTGLLSPAGTAVAASAQPWTLQIDTSGKFLYARRGDNDLISVFQIDFAGMPVFSRSVPTRKGAPGMITVVGGDSAVNLTPQFAYVANGSGLNILGFGINSTGSLTQLTSTIPGGQPIALAAAPLTFEPQLIELSQPGPSSLHLYGIDPTTSQLSGGAALDAGPAPKYLVIDRSNRFVFSSDGATSQIRMFGPFGSYVPTTTTFVSGALANDATGRYLFALNPTNASVSVYAVGAAWPSLTQEPGSTLPVATGTNPVGLTTDGVGSFLYVANQGSNSISVYSIDFHNSAALTPISGSPLPLASPPVALCSEPTGQYLFVADASGITTYRIDSQTGSLTSVANTVLGAVPNGLTVDEGGKYLYVAGGGAGVMVYSFDLASGFLSQVTGSPFAVTDARSIVTQSKLQ